MHILMVSYWDFMEHGIAVTRLTPTFFGEHGHRVTFLTHPEMTAKPALINDLHPNVKVVRFDLPLKWLGKIPKIRRIRQLFLFWLYCWWYVFRHCRGKNRPDVIYAAECDAILSSRWLAKLLRVPLITRFYGVSAPLVQDPKRFVLYGKAVRTPADLAIVTNDGSDGERVLRSINPRIKQICFFRNGVDITPPSEAERVRVRELLKLPSDATMLLAVSRLDDCKRVDRVVRAAGILFQDKAFNGKLVVVGHGHLFDSITDLARSLGVEDRIAFTGAVRHDEIGGYYAAADLFLSCYAISNVGNPLLEALATGLPIVTLNTASTSDVITHGKNGLLVEPVEDEETLVRNVADAVVEILQNPELRATLSEGAKAYARQNFWSWNERLSAELSAIENLVVTFHSQKK